MSFSEWLIIGIAALLLNHDAKEDAADIDASIDEDNRYIAELEAQQSEQKRRRSVKKKRCSTPCFFSDGLSKEDFEEIAQKAARKIKRIKNITVSGGVIYCNVESQTGYSDWDFNVDFNNWGHITGKYWTHTDNDDSSIPQHYGQMVSGWIQDFYRERGISLRDLSYFVSKNKDLETERGLNYIYKKTLLQKLFGNNDDSVSVSYGIHDLVGEHLYPVISMLRDSGFKNIRTFSIKDINDKSTGYFYQVEQVVIDGNESFGRGMSFTQNVEVHITYHEKQTISMPFSQNELRRENYVTVGDRLRDLGFTQIFERKIADLVTGWIIQNGSVESVLVDGDENKPIKKNELYDYDQKLVICYHTKK